VEPPFHLGAKSEFEVDACLCDLGFHQREQIAAGAGPAITLADVLNKIQSGEFSYLWNVHRRVQDFCPPTTETWG
jgi:hypothetical protein